MNFKKSFYIKIILFLILLTVLFYSRFVNLDWGLPYPFHPDERNMVWALEGLSCKGFSISNLQFSIQNCFNPHFFAYGQFPIYLGYLLIQLYFLIIGRLGSIINFQEGAYSLRFISAFSSILTVVYGVKIVDFIKQKNSKTKIYYRQSIYYLITIFLFIFSPGLIQFAHFGTTESLLMLFYTAIIYFSLKIIHKSHKVQQNIIFLSLISGLAIATKVSAVVYILIPILAVLINNKNNLKKKIVTLLKLVLLTAFFSLVFSPHNLINFNDFLGTLRYESDVALGRVIPFYTRQFMQTVPFLFQFKYIFPYALGWPVFIFFILGFFILPFNKKINLMRLAFIVVFIPNGLFFAKWTRFMSPVFPIMLILAILTLLKLFNLANLKFQFKIQNLKALKFLPIFLTFALLILTFLMALPGIAYFSVYQDSDVRFTASNWMDKNIPDRSYILSETANVVDLPMRVKSQNLKLKSYYNVSFNFYDLDESKQLQRELKNHLTQADYIIIPSRRVFMNETCYQGNQNLKVKTKNYFFYKNKCLYLKKKYPLLNKYYDKLFSEKLGFVKVAEFSSYPKIKLFNKTLIEFPDEEAEETWTVFDHPVIRIYKKE